MENFSQEELKAKINALCEQLDSKCLEEVDPEQIKKTYQRLYEHGQIIEGADNYLTFSFTNLTGQYQQKLLLTAMIAYQFHANDEWEVPRDVHVFPVYEYFKGLEEGRDIIDEHYKKMEISPQLAKDIKTTKEKMNERLVIRKFLEHLYQFDPSRHVRSAYRPNPRDKERTILETPAAKLAIECLKFKDAEFREAMFDHERNRQLANMGVATASKDSPYTVNFFNDLVNPEINVAEKCSHEFLERDKELYNICTKLSSAYEDIDKINVEYINSSVNIMKDIMDKLNEKYKLDQQTLLDIEADILESYNERLGLLQTENRKGRTILQDIIREFHLKYGLRDDKISINSYNMIPPQDTFHNIKYYMEANYDALVDAVKHLYCECPSIDMAILPHNWHATEEDARDYIKRHKSQAITEMITARSGMWNFFAPYSKVRDSTVFLNDKTAVLEEILNQTKRDQQMGMKLMEKQIKVKKRENIEREGPEAEAFKEWRKTNSTLRDMGAIEIDPNEDDCPINAIEIPVIRVNPAKGELKKDKFYTEAVAPEPPKDK